MSRFHYRALTPQGDVVEDVMDAPSRDTVLARLREADRLPIKVVPVDGTDGAVEAIGGERPSTRSRERGRHGRVPPDVLAIFTRQLATLLDASVSLPEALSIMVDAAASEAIGAIAGRLRRRVREGVALSEAMAAHPETFDSFYRAMVHAGEGVIDAPGAN